LGRQEKLPLGSLAKLMTEDAKTPWGITESVGYLDRRESFDKIGTESFILTMGRIGEFEEETTHIS
jgi:hypothetical protein